MENRQMCSRKSPTLGEFRGRIEILRTDNLLSEIYSYLSEKLQLPVVLSYFLNLLQSDWVLIHLQWCILA